jgi:hypothetical protein
MLHKSVKVSNAHGVLVQLMKMKDTFNDLLLFAHIVLTIPIVPASCRAELLDHETRQNLAAIHQFGSET